MAEIRRLNAHDPMPEGGHSVIVMRQFDEDDPHKTVVEVTLTHRHGLPERTHPARADGSAMGLEEAVEAARAVADEAGIAAVDVIDRTAGPREQDILQHDGDHTVNMDLLDDDDREEGERGPDMRDRT